jgi:DNA-3-methyladenine glycosylase I
MLVKVGKIRSKGERRMKRCAWAEKTEIERQYHDQKWGIPTYEEDQLFEMLILETMQAGLSWSTILNKRASLKKAYSDWDYQRIANYDEAKLSELLLDPGIIRNKLKVKATVSNAKAFIHTQAEFGSFSKYIWSFVNNEPIQNRWRSLAEVPATTELSDRISKDLKKRGFKFVGSTTIYAFMQSIGMVNDHLQDCFCYETISTRET